MLQIEGYHPQASQIVATPISDMPLEPNAHAQTNKAILVWGNFYVLIFSWLLLSLLKLFL